MQIYLDSVICIYAVEGAPSFQASARARLATMQAAGDQPAISDLTWLERRVKQHSVGKPPGEEKLVAGGVGFFLCARDHPNMFALMAGPRLNVEGAFPGLEAAMADTMAVFYGSFVGSGLNPGLARVRTGLFISALQGVTTQILHGRLRVSRTKAKDFIADTCRRLFDGLR